MILEDIFPNLLNIFLDLIKNKIFISVFLAYFVTQCIKITYLAIKEKKFNLEMFLRRSSMPSAHSATVICLMTSLYILYGLEPITVVAFVLASIVIRDLLDANLGIPKEDQILTLKNLKTYIHKPKEVYVGALVGYVIPHLVF